MFTEESLIALGLKQGTDWVYHMNSAGRMEPAVSQVGLMKLMDCAAADLGMSAKDAKEFKDELAGIWAQQVEHNPQVAVPENLRYSLSFSLVDLVAMVGFMPGANLTMGLQQGADWTTVKVEGRDGVAKDEVMLSVAGVEKVLGRALREGVATFEKVTRVREGLERMIGQMS